MIFRIIISFFLLAFTFSANAQKKWTLRECIDHALTNNIGVKQSEIDVNIAGEQLKQAKASVYPSLNGIATNNYNFGQRIDPFTNQFATSRVRSNSFSLNANVDLFRGFQVQNNIKQQDFIHVAAKYRSDEIRNDLALAVANAYLSILLSQELLTLAQNQADITRQQLKQVEILVDAGSLPQGESLNLTAQLAREEVEIVRSENQLAINYLNLRQLMQMKADEPLDIGSPELDINESQTSTLTSAYIFEQSKDVMPQVKTAEYNLRSSEKALDVARGSRSPILSLGASYGTGYSGLRTEVIGTEFAGQVQIGQTSTGLPVYTNQFTTETRTTPFSDQLENNLNQTIGLSLSIPIFNNFSSRTSINVAKLRVLNAQYDLEQTKVDLRNDIETAGNDARTALSNYKANEKAVEALDRSFGYAQERFDAGLVNAVDLNIEKNNLTRAKSELLQAKYDYIFKTKVLDFFLGKPIAN